VLGRLRIAGSYEPDIVPLDVDNLRRGFVELDGIVFAVTPRVHDGALLAFMQHVAFALDGVAERDDAVLGNPLLGGHNGPNVVVGDVNVNNALSSENAEQRGVRDRLPASATVNSAREIADLS